MRSDEVQAGGGPREPDRGGLFWLLRAKGFLSARFEMTTVTIPGTLTFLESSLFKGICPPFLGSRANPLPGLTGTDIGDASSVAVLPEGIFFMSSCFTSSALPASGVLGQ